MAPTLPQITPRGLSTTRQSSHFGPPISVSERVRHSDPHDSRKGPDKFSKLKSVLVSNVLKGYHKRMNKQADEAIYALAVQEVNKILSNGKLTEQKLRELQRNFANGLAQGPYSRQQVADGNSIDKDDGDMDQISLAHVAESDTATHNLKGVPVSDATQTTKGRAKLDEWSVLSLYDDVKHLEEVNELKQKRAADKARTRAELQVQIEKRKREKEAAKAAELALAQQQKESYENWQKEKALSEEQKKSKILAQRDLELQVMQDAQMKKKLESEQERLQEQERMRDIEKQLEAEKKAQEQKQIQRKVQYQQTLVDNQRVLELKQERSRQEREEDSRLFQLQLEMAEKQERHRLEQEQHRLAKLKAAERVAGILGNRAAEIEAQVEERVRKADQERQQREAVQERLKREAKERRQQEQLQSLQQQVQEHNDARARRVAEERALAEKLRSDTEEFKRAQAVERSARRRTQLEHRALLDQQRQLQHAQREQRAGMTETEMRINAAALQRVALN